MASNIYTFPCILSSDTRKDRKIINLRYSVDFFTDKIEFRLLEDNDFTVLGNHHGNICVDIFHTPHIQNWMKLSTNDNKLSAIDLKSLKYFIGVELDIGNMRISNNLNSKNYLSYYSFRIVKWHDNMEYHIFNSGSHRTIDIKVDSKKFFQDKQCYNNVRHLSNIIQGLIFDQFIYNNKYRVIMPYSWGRLGGIGCQSLIGELKGGSSGFHQLHDLFNMQKDFDKLLWSKT